MSKIWTSKGNEVHRQWWNAIVDEASDNLNDWETKFIEEIGTKIANNWNLTELQENKLEDIYAKYTS